MKPKAEEEALVFTTRLVLANLFKQNNLTLEEVAKKTKLTQSNLSRILRGEAPIAIDALSAIAKAFDCNASDILLKAEKMTSKLDTDFLQSIQKANPQQLSKSAQTLCNLWQEEGVTADHRHIFQFLQKQQVATFKGQAPPPSI